MFNLLYGPIAALVLLGIAPGDFEGFDEIANLANGVGTVLILFAGLLFGSSVAGYAAGWFSNGKGATPCCNGAACPRDLGGVARCVGLRA